MQQSQHAKQKSRVGIIGAGQLARMTIYKAKQWGLVVNVYSDVPDAPALEIANRSQCGAFSDIEKLREFCKNCDVVTFDLEDVHLPTLEQLESEGVLFYPKLSTLKIIQNKLLQRQLLAKHSLPQPKFAESGRIQTASDLPKGFSLPCVQKLQTGGYDGKGVRILRTEADFSQSFSDKSLVEDLVPIAKEISVVLARTADGDVAVYEPVEMVVDQSLNCLDYLVSPARVSSDIRNTCIVLARKVAEVFDLVGIGAIEMFLTNDNQLLINEIAPRPHNSGHHTIESSLTSQFEQHLRAILDLPLGDPSLLSPSVLCNVLGSADDLESDAFYERISDVLKLKRVQLHLYGKKSMRKGRKMGHVTVLDQNVEAAIRIAKAARDCLKALGDSHVKKV